MLLAGKVAVVSGVGPGLGHEIAVAFAREGADVVVAARTGSYLDGVVATIEAMGRRALAVPTNIADPEQCRRLAATALAEFNRIDCLVNNAFRPDVFQRFEDVDLSAWRKIMDVNLWGTLQLTQAVVPPMRAQEGGSIIFVNSMEIRKVRAGEGGYISSKGALLSAAQVLAKELGGYGIRVNSIVPGWMMGPNVEMYLQFRADENGTTRQEEYERIAREIPLGRIPEDGECANAAVFLASDLACVITGQSLDVNGGEVFH